VWLILEILIWVIATLALLTAAAFVAGRWFFVERYPDEIHYAKTEDGWRIALIRYRPERPNGGDPVLVCHGVASNSTGVDLTDELSLARALAAAGHDTWLLELRGRGLSGQPRLFGKHRWDWSFDEYVERDAPAAIAALLRATNRESLHWVGFALGACVGYGILGDEKLSGKMRSAVAIAGPIVLQAAAEVPLPLAAAQPAVAAPRASCAPDRAVAGYWRPKLLHNPENIRGRSSAASW
jgi:pimeloyl-ACP methyl ester carboxylesterase